MAPVAPGPDWATIMTAIGTVAVAVVAVGVALFAEWRASKRVREEREHAARQLATERARHDKEIAEERELADKRLADQFAHSDAQLADERAHSAAQIAEERGVFQEREQLAEAYAVEVLTGEQYWAREDQPPAKRITAIVINHGRYTITHVEAQLRLSAGAEAAWRAAHGLADVELDDAFAEVAREAGGRGSPGLVSFDERCLPERIKDLDGRLTGGYSPRLEEFLPVDRLTPWDLCIRFESHAISSAQLPSAYPVVRWMDRWGTRWEHRRGEVRQIRDGQEWQP